MISSGQSGTGTRFTLSKSFHRGSPSSYTIWGTNNKPVSGRNPERQSQPIDMNNILTPWRKNPKVHHRTHNSPPPVPVLSQSNLIHTSQANLPKIHSDPIFPPTPWSSKLSLPRAFPPKPCTLFSPLPCVLHAPPTSFALT
jgi:hypothetical protein